MDKVKRKNRREHRKLRIILPPMLLILAVIVVILGWNTRKEASQVEVKEKILTAERCIRYRCSLHPEKAGMQSRERKAS